MQLFLTEANKASVPISSTIINEFGEACKDAFKKQFTEERETKFKPRMSSIGKPLCQLQMEKSGAKPETPSYKSKMKFLFGKMWLLPMLFLCYYFGILKGYFFKKEN